MTKDGRQAERSGEGLGRRTLLNGACVGGVAAAAALLPSRAPVAHADEKAVPELPAGQPYRIILDLPTPVEFSALTQFSTKVQIAPTLEVSADGGIHARVLGEPEPARIGLRRSFAGSDQIWAWYQAARAGVTTSRRDINLRFVDADGVAVAKYHLQNAVPAEIDLDIAQTLRETVLLVASEVTAVPVTG